MAVLLTLKFSTNKLPTEYDKKSCYACLTKEKRKFEGVENQTLRGWYRD